MLLVMKLQLATPRWVLLKGEFTQQLPSLPHFCWQRSRKTVPPLSFLNYCHGPRRGHHMLWVIRDWRDHHSHGDGLGHKLCRWTGQIKSYSEQNPWENTCPSFASYSDVQFCRGRTS